MLASPPDLLFLMSTRKYRGVLKGLKQVSQSLQEHFLGPPTRLALLNILCRMPLSIFTAYGLTA